VVLGPRLPDLGLLELLRRLRSSSTTRHVSTLVLVPAGEPTELEAQAVEAGANAALRRPLDTRSLEAWIAKLLEVPRRVETRVPVQVQLIGSPRDDAGGHFCGVTRNISVHGLLLASPMRLDAGLDLDLEFALARHPRLTALGRVVREAGEVAWPYIGYGVEFLFLPPLCLEAIHDEVAQFSASRPRRGIHSTLRSAGYVYEILEPVPYQGGWQTEIRRAPSEQWRPGQAGPFYVVEGASRDRALSEAASFLRRQH
jgi:CheY-like chemotaxis protein